MPFSALSQPTPICSSHLEDWLRHKGSGKVRKANVVCTLTSDLLFSALDAQCHRQYSMLHLDLLSFAMPTVRHRVLVVLDATVSDVSHTNPTHTDTRVQYNYVRAPTSCFSRYSNRAVSVCV